jgi:hypothetical protein
VVDRDFLVHAGMKEIGVNVYIPSFQATDRSQFQASDIEKCEAISQQKYFASI